MNDNSESKIKVLDLFCGAGGLSKGFEQAGFEVIAGVDCKELFLETYEENHDGMAIQADLMEVTPGEFFDENPLDEEEIDVIIGGPPCKGFSIAGKRDPEDERNNLVDKFIDFVEHVQPKMFLMENVTGIKTMKDGKVLNLIMKRFENAGYERAQHETLNSADYGVPQERRRVIFLGRIDGKVPTYPERTHGPKGQKRLDGKELKPHATVKEALIDKDFQDLPNHDKTNHDDEMVERMSEVEPGEGLYEHYGDSWKRLVKDEPAPTVKENHNAPFIHPVKNRVGTVRECAVLQSFPDDFIFKGPKSQQLKQVGNAVPTLLAKRLAETMKEDLKEMMNG